MAAEIVGRVFAGVGGNGMYLGCLTLIIVYTTEKEKAVYLAAIGIFWGLGTVLGPVVGGGFAIVWWPWAFFINPMIGVFCILICVLCIPATDPKPGTPNRQRIAEFDFVGSILITAAITTLVMAINFGGTTYAWNGGQTIALFVLSGVLFISFGLQQVFCIFTRAGDRIFPVQFMKNRNAIILFVCTAAINTAAFIPIYYIPIYFQFTRGDSAIESAVRLFPLIFLLSFTIFTNGQLMVKYGSFQDWYVGGSILTIVGGVLMSRIDVNTSTSAIYGYEVLLALGTGAFVQAGYTTVYFVIEPKDGAYGVSFISLAQLGGIALGLSIAGSVFVNRAVAGLAVVLPNLARAQLEAAVSGTSSSTFNNLPSETRALALSAIVASLSNTFVSRDLPGSGAFASADFCSGSS
ncbi:hypothetical protein MMC27_008447 [Xylographa pallens]|nr:hypothetical protein [Xylographa pallens]